MAFTIRFLSIGLCFLLLLGTSFAQVKQRTRARNLPKTTTQKRSYQYSSSSQAGGGPSLSPVGPVGAVGPGVTGGGPGGQGGPKGAGGIPATAAPGTTTMIYTPTLWAVEPDAVACNLSNLASDSRLVRVRIISNGQVLFDSGNVMLDPMYTIDNYAKGSTGGRPMYCEFSLQGTSSEFRGAVKLFEQPNGSDKVALSAF